jgi:predicted nuclease with TOPRIM domain
MENIKENTKKEAILNNLQGRIRQIAIENYKKSKDIECLIDKIHLNPSMGESLKDDYCCPENNIVEKLKVDISVLSETDTLLTSIYIRLKDLVG